MLIKGVPSRISGQASQSPGASSRELQSDTSFGWDWWNSRALFAQAVDELMHIYNIRGLILDFRTNWGGYPEYANDGLKQLFNFDPTTNYGVAKRVPGGDHLAFSLASPRYTEHFPRLLRYSIIPSLC